MSERLEQTLKKYFSKQQNVDYIINKTSGQGQVLKIYEIVCLLKNPDDEKKNIIKVVEYLKKNKLLWANPVFDLEKRKVEEENDFMVCPYEISEGVLICGKCVCKKIYSFTKQTRSMDEPTTVFAMCSDCGYKWCEGS